MPSAALVAARAKIEELLGLMNTDLQDRRDALETARTEGTDTVAPRQLRDTSRGALTAVLAARTKALQIR